MTRISLVTTKQTIAVLIVTAASVVPLYSQELKTSSLAQTATATSAQTSAEPKQSNPDSSAVAENSGQVDSNQTSAQQPTSQVYTFPTNEERFNRYVKSTVGPFSLARTAISAGIDQWSDHPDEWEQGASGFGKRYASRFWSNSNSANSHLRVGFCAGSGYRVQVLLGPRASRPLKREARTLDGGEE